MGQDQCKNAIKVTFNFTPTDSSARSRYGVPDWPDSNQTLTVGDGKHPPREWVIDQGLLEGTHHPCVRKDIVKGTCTPVSFQFLDIDYKAANKWCF